MYLHDAHKVLWWKKQWKMILYLYDMTNTILNSSFSLEWPFNFPMWIQPTYNKTPFRHHNTPEAHCSRAEGGPLSLFSTILLSTPSPPPQSLHPTIPSFLLARRSGAISTFTHSLVLTASPTFCKQDGFIVHYFARKTPAEQDVLLPVLREFINLCGAWHLWKKNKKLNHPHVRPTNRNLSLSLPGEMSQTSVLK